MSTEPVPRKPGLRHMIHTRMLSGSPSQTTLISIRKAPKRQEAGAGLIIIVLLAMLMLAALLVISANLSLSARRTTADQRAVLPAQYSAESGLSYAKSLLTASQTLMSNSTLPANTTYGQLKSWISGICANNSTVPVPGYTKASASNQTIPNTSIIVPQSVKVCDVSTFSLSQANFFAQVIPNAGAAATSYYQFGLPATTPTERQDFFDKVFSADRNYAVNGAQVKAGLLPVALFQTDQYEYVLYFRVAGVDSVGSSSGSDRRVTVRGNDTLHGFKFSFLLPLFPPQSPNFTAYGQFVNKWGSAAGFYGYGNDFSGPFHTNSIPSFRGSAGSNLVRAGSSISIDGALTSRGCNNVVTAFDVQGNRSDSCNPLVYQSSLVNDFANNTATYIQNSAMSAQPGTQAGNFSGTSINYTLYGGTGKNSKGEDKPIYIQVAPNNNMPKFDAPFVNMPINSKNQRDLGATSGILLNNPQKVQLSVNGSGSTAFQVIDILPTGSPNAPVRLRFGADKKMFIESPYGSNNFVAAVKGLSSTGWIAAGTGIAAAEFNGMIYADGDIGSLSGPLRPNGSATANGQPAIASFAGITVTSEKNVTLTGDILYETRCLKIRACVQKTNDQYQVKNIFGIYSGKGDVRIAYDPNNAGQNIEPGTGSSAPKNLEIDGFVMAGFGHVIPYNAAKSDNSLDSGTGSDKGKFIVHGGTIKDEDAIVRSGSRGWSENYYYDARGQDYSPPGFPTTTTGVPGVDPTDASFVQGWLPALGKTNPDGTQNGTVDFSLDNEFRQEKNQ
jgi:Tfp pilus assembly protein PilX